MAAAAVAAIPPSLVEPLGIAGVRSRASAVTQGLAVGLLVSLLFALVPLLEIRRVKPLLLLRADTVGTARARDWQSVLAGALTVLALALVAVWQAGSLRAGLFVSAGLLVVALVLLGVSRLLIRADRAARAVAALRVAPRGDQPRRVPATRRA